MRACSGLKIHIGKVHVFDLHSNFEAWLKNEVHNVVLKAPKILGKTCGPPKITMVIPKYGFEYYLWGLGLYSPTVPKYLEVCILYRTWGNFWKP